MRSKSLNIAEYDWAMAVCKISINIMNYSFDIFGVVVVDIAMADRNCIKIRDWNIDLYKLKIYIYIYLFN